MSKYLLDLFVWGTLLGVAFEFFSLPKAARSYGVRRKTYRRFANIVATIGSFIGLSLGLYATVLLVPSIESALRIGGSAELNLQAIGLVLIFIRLLATLLVYIEYKGKMSWYHDFNIMGKLASMKPKIYIIVHALLPFLALGAFIASK